MRIITLCVYAMSISSLVGATPAAALAEGLETTAQTSEIAAAVPESAVISEPSPQTEQPAAGATDVAISSSTPSAEIPLAAAVATTPDAPVSATKLIVSEVRLRTCASPCQTESKDGSFVEVYNPEATPVTVNNWKVNYYTASTTFAAPTTTLALLQNIVIEAHGYAVIGIGVTAPSPAPVVAMAAAGIGSKTSGYIRVVTADGTVSDQVGWGSVSAAGTRVFAAPTTNSSAQMCETGGVISMTTTFAEYTTVTPGTGVVCPVAAPPMEVNMCSGLLLSEIGANRDDQFIELYNASDHVIDVTGCQVQTNRSATKTVTFGNETLEAGAYRVIAITDTDLTLTKTTTGTVYLLSSDGKTEIDSQTYSNLPSGTAWARFADGWQQTYSATPGAANVWQLYLPCDEGYVRNEATGRCNKIAVETMPTDCGEGKYRSEETGRCRTIPAASVLAACKLGQYRSEETNRCRNVVAASTAKPCKDGQYRSEETNRCRNIAAASTNLKPCKDTQYRSEQTNRCRNLPAKTVPAAAYAVEPVQDSAKAFIGWWALGGVAVLAVGYAAWEWRREIRQWLYVVTRFGKRP